MIQKLAEHKIPFLLLIILLLIQSFSIDLNDTYRKPINGDAQAYYAYLPAIFIYQDLDYKFIPEMQAKYYNASSAKSFLKDIDGEKVNKTFPGVTVLYAPFFLIAHASSLLLDLPADGYAYTYQLFYLIGFWFYFLLGMIFFRKILITLNFSKFITSLTLIIIVLGTNIFFFTVYDQSVTHIYSFFLINWAIYLLLKLYKNFGANVNPNLRTHHPGDAINRAYYALPLFLTLVALIGITRPTNILVIGLFLFFIPDLKFYQSLFQYIFRTKTLFKTLLFPVIILAIPFILWKLQTGRWIVYSYGEEGFQFLNPEGFNFLFSYTKGWFLYTPILLPILVFGFIALLPQNKKQAFIGIIFLVLCIYIYSSWWCWYYGAGMSQRVMIDFYILPGFLLASILQKLSVTFAGRSSFLGAPLSITLVTAILVAFNMAQAYQVSNGILPGGSPTEEQYWDNFLVMQKRALVYPQDHWKLVNNGTISLDPADGQIIKGSAVQSDDDWSLRVDQHAEYSALVQIPQQHFKKGSKLIVSFEAKGITPLELSRIVFELDSTRSYAFFPQVFITDEWEKMQYLIEPDAELISPVDIYLWNAASSETLELKNLSWELYFTEAYF